VLGVPLTGDNGDVTDQGLVLIPAPDLTVEDVWYVTGMRGTASNCLVAADVFVPSDRVMSVPAAIEGRYPTPYTDEPLYRSSFVRVLTLVPAARNSLRGPGPRHPQGGEETCRLHVLRSPGRIGSLPAPGGRRRHQGRHRYAALSPGRGRHRRGRRPGRVPGLPDPRQRRLRGAERSRGAYRLDERARGQRLRGLQPRSSESGATPTSPPARRSSHLPWARRSTARRCSAWRRR
jgi:hypothetical protein